MKNSKPINDLNNIFQHMKTMAYDSSPEFSCEVFCQTFYKGENITEFCRGVYNHFKGYKALSDKIDKSGLITIFAPSYIVREKAYDVKSLCVIYSKVLQYHSIAHDFQLIYFPEHKNAYCYITAVDEEGNDIHLHTDFSVPFNQEIPKDKESEYYNITKIADNLEVKIFNTDQHLNEVLANREKSLGIGGDYTFLISVKLHGGKYGKFIALPKLTKEAARKQFDLFDENNLCSKHVDVKIQILDKDEKEVDLNFLPNAHTDPLE